MTSEAQLLGPPDSADENNLAAATWEPVNDSEIDLGLLVTGMAKILVMSRY